MPIVMRQHDRSDDLVIARFGELGGRLASAILADEALTGEVIEEAARQTTGPDDWVGFLEAVRSACIALIDNGSARRRAERTTPTAPGDTQSSAIPVDAVLLTDAFDSLTAEDRDTLWDALLCRSQPEEASLARALARLRDAVRSSNFPQAEDIP